MRKAALCAAVMAAATQLLFTAAAGATKVRPIVPSGPAIMPIGPEQFFDGLINPGPLPVTVTNSSSPAIIHMACFGPEPVGGRMGHPLAGQSTAVTRVIPITSAAIPPGFTGLADSIEATVYFPVPVGPPTPVAVPSPAGVHLGVFKYYDDPAPISTEVELPCSGSGVVVFNPLLGGPSARSADVGVEFVGQP
jgi:hypothetical protein